MTNDQNTKSEIISWVKEAVTAFIGLAIVLLTLYVAARTFGDRGAPPAWTAPPQNGQAQNTSYERVDPFDRGKDILLLLIPLTGAIVGYYTGRVIADRSIDQANAAAAGAQRELSETLGDVANTLSKEILDQLKPAWDEMQGLGAKAAPAYLTSLGKAREAALDLLIRLRARR